MTARTARRLRSTFWITLVCVVVAIAYEVIDAMLDPEPTVGDFPLGVVGFVIGVGLGVSLSILELSSFSEKLTRLPFTVSWLVKTATYVFVPTAVFLAIGLIVGTMAGLGWSDFWGQFKDPSTYIQIGVGAVLYLVIIFFRQLDRLLGPGVLIRVLLGRYHSPRREQRIFMFLDLKASTTIAERLTHEAYYSFVNDFFRDLSLPVLNAGGEIYQYVGDEVVITWKQRVGTQDANCLRIFPAIDDALQERKQHYLDRYGIFPEYKAGAHVGEVITAEIGDLKKEIVYNGDVLNTASRIQSMCNELGRRFVASRALVQEMAIPERLALESLGPVSLRGRTEPVELVGLA